MGILLGFFNLFNILFDIFMTFLIAIPVFIVVIVLIVWQSKKNKKAAQKIDSIQKAHIYCRNCGKNLNGNQKVCISCGVKVGDGKRYCYRCGSRTDELAIVCISCGVSLDGQNSDYGDRKSKVAAGLLGIFLGSLGVHNFYLGYTIKAFAQVLLTLFFIFCTVPFGLTIMFIWGVIEGIMILAGGISKDANGTPLK